MYKTIEQQIVALLVQASRLADENNCTIYVDTPDAERGAYGLPLNTGETIITVSRH